MKFVTESKNANVKTACYLATKIIITTISFAVVSCSGVQSGVATQSAPESGLKPQVISKVHIDPIESRFEIVRELPYFKEMVKVADCVTNLKEFQDEVSSLEKFGNTTDSGKQILEKMLMPTKAKIRHYRPWNFKSSVTAYTVGEEVYFNSRMKRLLKDNVNTAIHERLHVLGYKHVSKYNVGRDKDNAYIIGNLSEKYVERCNGL